MTFRLEDGECGILGVEGFDSFDVGLLAENPSPTAMMELIHKITSVGCLFMVQIVNFGCCCAVCGERDDVSSLPRSEHWPTIKK
jgi:hypothetical protein